MLRRSFKFKVHPAKKGERRTEIQKEIALWVAVVACIAAYYLFGAGGWMLTITVLTYFLTRLLLLRRR